MGRAIDMSEVRRLERRLRAAKQRALYWSGNPTFTGKRFRPTASRQRCMDQAMQYEMAMSDIRSLTEKVNSMDGKKRKLYDPAAEFRKRFLAAMRQRP